MKHKTQKKGHMLCSCGAKQSTEKERRQTKQSIEKEKHQQKSTSHKDEEQWPQLLGWVEFLRWRRKDGKNIYFSVLKKWLKGCTFAAVSHFIFFTNAKKKKKKKLGFVFN